jgi:hypothetical protein
MVLFAMRNTRDRPSGKLTFQSGRSLPLPSPPLAAMARHP